MIQVSNTWRQQKKGSDFKPNQVPHSSQPISLCSKLI